MELDRMRTMVPTSGLHVRAQSVDCVVLGWFTAVLHDQHPGGIRPW